MRKAISTLLFALLLWGPSVGADEIKPAPADDLRSLDDKVQTLKKEALDLSRDLIELEQSLIFPDNTQIAVFLSAEMGNLFRLDSVQLQLDDQVVANHLYTEAERNALMRGGVQRLHLGNIGFGQHQLVLVFNGMLSANDGKPENREGKPFQSSSAQNFDKGTKPKYVEFRITNAMKPVADAATQKPPAGQSKAPPAQLQLQPQLDFKQWE